MPVQRPRIATERLRSCRRGNQRKGSARAFVVWLAVCLWFALCAGLPSHGRAEAERDVEVRIAGDRETSRALQSGMLEFSEQRDVRVSWNFARSIDPREVLAKPPPGSTAFARIWLDVRSNERAVLYIADTTSDRFLLRVVPLEAGYDEVARESLGNIVESAIDALLAGAEIGVSREVAEEQVAEELGEAPPPAAPPPTEVPPQPSPPAAKSTRSATSTQGAWFVGYRGETLRGRQALRHGPELGGMLTGRGPWSPMGMLSLGYRLPSQWEGEELSLRLQGAGARALFGVRADTGSVRFYFGVGPGFEATRVEAAPTAGVMPRGPLWTAAPMAVGSLGLGVALGGSFELMLAAAGEVDLRGHHFDVIGEQGATPVLEPWLVRPTLTLSLLFNP